MVLDSFGSPRTAPITLPVPPAPLVATTVGPALLNHSAIVSTLLFFASPALSAYGSPTTTATASAGTVRSPVGTMKLPSLKAVTTVRTASVVSGGLCWTSPAASRELAVSTPLLLGGVPVRPGGTPPLGTSSRLEGLAGAKNRACP